MRYHIAPEIRRGGIAVQENNGIALSDLNICHLVAQDWLALFLERKACRNQGRFSFRPNSIGLTIARLYTIILMQTGVELLRKGKKNCTVVALEDLIHTDYPYGFIRNCERR